MYHTIREILFANPAAVVEDIAKTLQLKAKEITEFFAAAKRESDMIHSVLAVGAGDVFWFQPPHEEQEYWTFPFYRHNAHDTGMQIVVNKEDFHWSLELGDVFEEPLLNPDELGLEMLNVDAGGHQYYKMFKEPLDPGRALAECLIVHLQARFGEFDPNAE